MVLLLTWTFLKSMHSSLLLVFLGRKEDGGRGGMEEDSVQRLMPQRPRGEEKVVSIGKRDKEHAFVSYHHYNMQ